MGRPSLYTSELAKEICSKIATSSNSMKTICEECGIALGTVLDWLVDNKYEEFTKMYARAKEMQADYLVEEMLQISDDGSNDYMTITKGDIEYNVENKEVTSRSKLRLDTRKFIASKLKPKKYGDKIEVAGDPANPLHHIITGMEIK